MERHQAVAAARVKAEPQTLFGTPPSTEAMKWLKENGRPVSGDDGQTNLEGHIADFLDSRGYDLADSTIRSHVAGWIVEYRGFLST